jgi:hypothetical protein
MAPKSDAPAEHGPAHVPGWWRRKWASIARWLHIYVSMVSFGILFFFAVTGLTLNHAERFFREPVVARKAGKLEPKWVAPGAADVAKLDVVEHLRRVDGVKGLVSGFRVEDAQCFVGFKGPGYVADATVDRATGSYELNETRMGFVAVINDLHKGRDTGAGWSWIVDLSAVLMIVVSVTGMVLIYFVKRRFVTGVVAAVAGCLASYLAYLWLVP